MDGTQGLAEFQKLISLYNDNLFNEQKAHWERKHIIDRDHADNLCTLLAKIFPIGHVLKWQNNGSDWEGIIQGFDGKKSYILVDNYKPCTMTRKCFVYVIIEQLVWGGAKVCQPTKESKNESEV